VWSRGTVGHSLLAGSLQGTRDGRRAAQPPVGFINAAAAKTVAARRRAGNLRTSRWYDEN